MVSLVLISGYRIVDYALTDETTLSHLIGTLATDVVKVGVVVAVSIGGALALGATVVAAGPILAVVIVGFGLTVALDQVDLHYGLTDKVIAGLEEMGDDASAYLQKRKEQALNQLGQMMNSVIDYAVDAAQRNAVILLKNSVERFVPSRPRL